MSDTEKKVESVEEQKNPANRDAAPAEAPTLKNDAEDLGAPVVKPTDSNPDATKKIKKVSDQVNKDANDGSLPNDQKPSSMKKEEVEDSEEVSEMAGGMKMNAMKMPIRSMKHMTAMKHMNAGYHEGMHKEMMRKMEMMKAETDPEKMEMMKKEIMMNMKNMDPMMKKEMMKKMEMAMKEYGTMMAMKHKMKEEKTESLKLQEELEPIEK